MRVNTNFTGRIVQITDSLDYGDAVSNQVIAMDRAFKSLGLSSAIFARWHVHSITEKCGTFDEMSISDNDIVIFHFCGYSEFAIPVLEKVNCTKILYYHNITPHDFFEKGSDLYKYCKSGRDQLSDSVRLFNYFWGASQYNLDELIALGIDPSLCSVIPIIVPDADVAPSPGEYEPGIWLFVGRIAANKRQVDLVDLFIDAHARDPEKARHLFLVGGFSAEDPYYRSLMKAAKRGIDAGVITITGKVSDPELNDHFRRADIYVSMSSHEGFGVPLVEAPLRGLPVVALDEAAVGETLGAAGVSARTAADLQREILAIAGNAGRRAEVLAAQQANAKRFSARAVTGLMKSAMRDILPSSGQFSTVSIVICTYNRIDHLKRCLDYLEYQTSDNFEVVVVNGPSNDGTSEYLDSISKKIKIGNNDRKNLSISRNIGIEIASGDIVAFIDDDAMPFADWVDQILKKFNESPLNLSAVGGPTFFAGSLKFQAEDIGFNKYAEAKENIDSSQVGQDGWVRSLLGTNTAFSKKHLYKVNGFDEQYDYFLDESDLTFRLQVAGSIVAYNTEMYLRHEFAQGHNRRGKHNFNWHDICKNTAYFISLYSGLSGKACREFIEKKMRRERILPLEYAEKHNEITKGELAEYTRAINSGAAQGVKDASRGTLLRQLSDKSDEFLPFPTNGDYPRVGKELPQLHICIVSKEFPPFSTSGGIGTLYYHLASELLLLGHRVTVVTTGNENNIYRQGRFAVESIVPGQVPFGDLDDGISNNLSWQARVLHRVAELHERDAIDIIDSALWDAEALQLALINPARRPPLALRLVTPFVVAAQTNEWSVPDRQRDQFVACETALIDASQAVIPISASIASTIGEEYGKRPDERWSIGHCGIAYWPFFDFRSGYDEFQELDAVSSKIKEAKKAILFVGRLERRKGLDLLIEAANTFLGSDQDSVLIVAGRDVEGWEERSKIILEPAVQDRVLFLGEVTDVMREKLLSKAYCVVFPSRYESFGIVPLEAFVHGVPVVASRSGAIPEVVDDGECGLLFEAGNAQSLGDAVARVISDEELRTRLAEGAERQIRKLSSKESAYRTIRLYRRLYIAKQRQRFWNPWNDN